MCQAKFSRCAGCVHSKGIENNKVHCYNANKNNYPYAIENSVSCIEYEKKVDIEND